MQVKQGILVSAIVAALAMAAILAASTYQVLTMDMF